MIYLYLAAFAIPVLCNLLPLIRKKRWLELAAFCVLSAITLVYVVALIQETDILNPFKSLAEFVEQKLGLSYASWRGHS